MLTLAICAFIVITLTIWVSFRVSVLVFFQLGSPLYGIVSCLIPFFLIYKVAQLEKLRGFKALADSAVRHFAMLVATVEAD